jgi:PAS domain-containing protein
MQPQVEQRKYLSDASVFNQFDDGVVILDEERTIVYSNAKAEALLCAEPHEIVGFDFTSFLSEKDSDSFATEFEHFGEREFEIDFYLPISDACVRARGFCYQSVCILTLKDISYRRHSDETLEALKSKLKSLVEGSLVGIMTTQLDGQILEANSALLNMLGYSHEDVRAGRLSWEMQTHPEW